MVQIPAVLTSSGIKSEVTLVSMGSSCVRSQLLSCEMEGQIELCTEVCIIAAELHKTIKPLLTSQTMDAYGIITDKIQ